MRVGGSTENARAYVTPPNGEYDLEITECVSKYSNTDEKGEIKDKTKPSNPMFVLDYVLERGPYDDKNMATDTFKGNTIRFHNVMTGGTTKEGKAMPLGGYAELLQGAQIPWTCMVCHPDALSEGNNYDGRYDRVSNFYQATGEEPGLEKGMYVCPDCKKPGDFSCDPAHIKGRKLRAYCASKKQNPQDPNSREFLEIGSIKPPRAIA